MTHFLSQKFIAAGLAIALVYLPLQTAEASSDDGWNYTVSPLFLWGMEINGSSTVGPSSLPLDLSFDDLISNLDVVFTMHFEAQKNDLTLFTEVQYAELVPETKIGPVKLDVDFKNFMAEFGAAYRVAGDRDTDWQVLGGARYFEQDLEVDIGSKGLIINNNSKIKSDNEWWNGFIGGRVKHQISDAWLFEARADYGEGSSSNYSTNAIFFFDYTFNDWGSAFVGYKYMKIKYDNDRSGLNHYTYDAEQQGPLAGLSIKF